MSWRYSIIFFLKFFDKSFIYFDRALFILQRYKNVSYLARKGGDHMSEKEKKSTEGNDKVVAQSFCSPIRSCCLYEGCLGTFVPLTGSTWILDHCGCKGGGGVIT